jgi:hypothetical protein
VIYHRIYTFDPHNFHEQLHEICVDGDNLNPKKLYKAACKTVSESLRFNDEITRDIRYGEEWLEYGDADDELNFWYMILLADSLKAFGRLPVVSHIIFQRVLPLAGWEKHETNTLLVGKNLNLLPAKYGNAVIGKHFTNLKQFGGWLELADLIAFRDRLQMAEIIFTQRSQKAYDAIRDYADVRGEDPAHLLQLSYSEALVVINQLIEQQRQAVFISFD